MFRFLSSGLSRGQRTATLGLAALAIVAAAPAQDSRVIVVKPSPGGTDVPLAPNEKIGAATSVNLPGRGPAVVIRAEQMPPKPLFNLITPGNISHPFVDGPSPTAPGISYEHELITINTPTGPRYKVRTTIFKNGNKIGTNVNSYPAGTVHVPDPPQPPGTMFSMPDAVPVPPEHEALVLGELGLPNNPWAEVFNVPSGILWLTSPSAGGLHPLEIRAWGAPGDLNCDRAVTVSDISGFVLALTDPAGYEASFPECSALAADLNFDEAITVSDIGYFVDLLLGE